jgi:hypothetical protein
MCAIMSATSCCWLSSESGSMARERCLIRPVLQGLLSLSKIHRQPIKIHTGLDMARHGAALDHHC